MVEVGLLRVSKLWLGLQYAVTSNVSAFTF